MGIQKIGLSTFRVWLWGQKLLDLNIPCEVLGQDKYFWGKYQKMSLFSQALELPVGLRLRLCDLLSRPAHLHWGFPNLGSNALHFIPCWAPPALLRCRHSQKDQGDAANTAVPPGRRGFSCSSFKLRGREHSLQEEGVWRSQLAPGFTGS